MPYCCSPGGAATVHDNLALDLRRRAGRRLPRGNMQTMLIYRHTCLLATMDRTSCVIVLLG